jgi:hypothetical protein
MFQSLDRRFARIEQACETMREQTSRVEAHATAQAQELQSQRIALARLQQQLPRRPAAPRPVAVESARP